MLYVTIHKCTVAKTSRTPDIFRFTLIFPFLMLGNPQEALDMTREAFKISERLQLPVIVRLTTRVAHGKGRVKIRRIVKGSRKAEFDKDASRWVMVPSNAIKRHSVLKEKIQEATKLVNSSDFNVIENNEKEIGIVGSGIGYYYARSVLDAKQFSWLKLGFVYPFPKEVFKNFASKVKKDNCNRRITTIH